MQNNKNKLQPTTSGNIMQLNTKYFINNLL